MKHDPFEAATVQQNHQLRRPTLYGRFHHVVPNYYADMLLAWEQLFARGYRRIGLALDGDLAGRVAHQWEAAHNYEQGRRMSAGAAAAVPTLLLDADDPASCVVFHRAMPAVALLQRRHH